MKHIEGIIGGIILCLAFQLGLVACGPTNKRLEELQALDSAASTISKLVGERAFYEKLANQAHAAVVTERKKAYAQGIHDGARGVKCVPQWSPETPK